MLPETRICPLLLAILVAACSEPSPGEVADEAEHDVVVDAIGRPLTGLARDLAIAHAEADIDLGLVARIETRPGEILSVYRPAPATIVFSSAGAPVGPLDLDPDRSLAGVWRRATDGAPMPPALVEVARVLGDTPVPMPPVAAHDERLAPTGPRAPSDAVAGWCDTTFYRFEMSDCELNANFDTDFKMCFDNRTTVASGTAGHAYFTSAVVCPNRGDVRIDLDTEHGWGTSIALEHTYEQWTVTNFSCIDPEHVEDNCSWTSFDVVEVEGDRYHFRMLADQK